MSVAMFSGRVDVELGVLGDTLGLDRPIPKALDRAAHHETDEQLRDAPGTNKNHSDLVPLAHILHGQYAIVLQQEGHLDGKETSRV
jgi:hypothetical protein